MYVYMKVTKDKYELPLIVTDTVQEMAERCGTTVNVIRSLISHEKAGRKTTCYKRVEIDD